MLRLPLHMHTKEIERTLKATLRKLKSLFEGRSHKQTKNRDTTKAISLRSSWLKLNLQEKGGIIEGGNAKLGKQ